ncbi:hypothetical protein CYMTET_15404 [Cymbomonas tetramitiformis]|uniref:Uncharacterized protein n=1 Tax=Cymbomonas tetramitiformis TaxID=36881 RepID=A0AAE0GE37_9CHLO|nr:hypothetical protein CYMTET_15404 [Cymbomonas tetramitiformis]
MWYECFAGMCAGLPWPELPAASGAGAIGCEAGAVSLWEGNVDERLEEGQCDGEAQSPAPGCDPGSGSCDPADGAGLGPSFLPLPPPLAPIHFPFLFPLGALACLCATLGWDSFAPLPPPPYSHSPSTIDTPPSAIAPPDPPSNRFRPPPALADLFLHPLFVFSTP